MPRVPTINGPQVAPTQAPAPRVDSGPSPALLARSAQNTAAVGQSIEQGGARWNAIQIQELQQANQLRVDDALNQVRTSAQDLTFNQQTGFANIKGNDALQRQSGQPLSDEYTGKLQERVSQITDSLGNDEQKRLFALRANDLVSQFRGNVMQHESSEYKNYQLSVHEGTTKIAMDDIGLHYNDPERINQNIQSIQAATYNSAKLLGKSADWADAQAKVMTSNAHKLAIEASLQNNDPRYANAYLKRYSDQMNTDDILRANGLITKQMDAVIGAGVATQVISGFSPRMSTSDGDRLGNLVTGPDVARLTGLVRNAESGGRETDAAGNVLTSSAGAKGSMQVMDSTNKDPGFSVKPAQDDSPAERARVGRDYLAAMLKNYQGNVPMALAAYNAGPGNVDSAMAAAKKAGDEVNWMKYLPKPQETIPYVQGIMKAYGDGGGQYQKPTLADIHAEVRARIGTGNPSQLKIALDESTRQFEEMGKAQKQRDEENVANAMRALMQNGGKYSALPLSITKDIPPDKVDNLLSFGQKIAKGDDQTNMAVYQRLSDTGYLSKLSDAQFFALRGELSAEDFKHFSNQRAVAQGRGTNKADEVNTQALNFVLNNRLQTLGIDPTPKDGSDDAQRVGAIRKFVTDSLLNQQRALGKQMTDAEVEKHIDGLYAKSATFRNTFLGIGMGTTSDRMLNMKPSDIPSAVKDRLKQDFKANGIDNPSDADLLGAYWRMKSTPKNAASVLPLNW